MHGNLFFKVERQHMLLYFVSKWLLICKRIFLHRPNMR